MEEARIWETFNCKDIEEIIKGNLRTIDEKFAQITASFVTNGYYLRRQHDEKMYVAEGYDSFEEYVKAVYGKSRSWAKRMMQINEKFSVGGNDPRIDKRYMEYSVSQLQEMLYLEDEQMEEATPGMTVKEIRELRAPEKKLVKPDEDQRKYLDAFARRFIDCKHDWLLQDFQNRVMHVDKSPVEIKKHLGTDHRTWYFATDNGTAHINLFDDYVQLWDERNVCLGDFDWFYLAAAIQRMWNIVAMENAQKKQETDTKMCDVAQANESNAEEQIPGQMKVEDYPELLPEKKEPMDNDINNNDSNLVDEQPEVVMDAECQEVIEEQPKIPDAMLTYLVETCIEELEIDDLFAESEDTDELHDGIYDELFEMSIRFRFNGTELRADFYGEISIYYAETEFELYTNYTWDQFFEELERVGDIGERYAAENAEMEELCCENSSDLDELIFSQIAIRDYLEEEERTLDEYEKVNSEDGGLPHNLMTRQRMLVKALRLLMEHEVDTADQDNVDEPEEQEELETVQPELPLLKNNDQRKEWLNNYKEWGLWYRDEHIDVNYYKYDFPDGSRLVVAEYPQRRMYWRPNELADEHYYHLLDKHRKWYGTDKTFDQQYVHSTDSETGLVEFLKNLQKGEKK